MAHKKRAEKSKDLYRQRSRSPERTLSLALGVPPSVNTMYHNTRRGGRVLTKTARKYIRDSKALINLAIEEQGWNMQGKYVWFHVDMVFYFPDRRVRDASNCLKILLDVMEGNVYENDYTVLPRVQSVELDTENPRVEVTVKPQTSSERKSAIQ